MKPDTGDEKEPEKAVSITDRTDGWLIRAWKSGDERAAEVLFDRYAIRLVALVASRLNRRYRSTIDPDEVVQSAMGSFFDAAKHSRIHVSGSVSLWRLLATFARRKMARSIERHSAAKRGGDHTRVSLDEVETAMLHDGIETGDDDADDFLRMINAELPEDLAVVVEGLLVGQTQRELAESLGVDERTVRRRLSRVRERLSLVVDEATSPSQPRPLRAGLVASSTTNLPRVSYHEFVLGKLIGSGGFSKVYRASMQTNGRTVAVKFLRKAFWQNEPARQSFLREINAASQINHASVIRYLGYGESPHGGPYVLSEWVDGQPLHGIAKPTTEQFTNWLIKICHALDAVHEAGLVHGDLAPSNILVGKDNRITITDFGFSQAPAAASPSILGGTLGFAAPEQIDPSFGSVSPKTDIYAIGGLVHWFLFQQPPASGVSAAEMLSKTLAPESSLREKQPGIPKGLNQILMTTLVSAPSARTITLSQIASCLHGLPTRDHSSGSTRI